MLDNRNGPMDEREKKKKMFPVLHRCRRLMQSDGLKRFQLALYDSVIKLGRNVLRHRSRPVLIMSESWLSTSGSFCTTGTALCCCARLRLEYTWRVVDSIALSSRYLVAAPVILALSSATGVCGVVQVDKAHTQKTSGASVEKIPSRTILTG